MGDDVMRSRSIEINHTHTLPFDHLINESSNYFPGHFFDYSLHYLIRYLLTDLQ